MIKPEIGGNNYKTIMKNQLSTPESSLGIAKNLWKINQHIFLKPLRSKPMNQKGYKVCSGMDCQIDIYQWYIKSQIVLQGMKSVFDAEIWINFSNSNHVNNCGIMQINY